MSGKTPRRHLCVFILTLALQTLSLEVLPNSEARDLTDVLKEGSSFRFVGKDTTIAATKFAPAFSEAIAQAIAQELPLASVAPAFSYRYNPALSIFERSTGVPGPLFSERALTLGKGQLNVGMGYSFVDFSDFNGTDLDNIQSPALLNLVSTDKAVQQQLVPPGVVLRPGETLFSAPSSASVIRTRLDLNAHIFVLSLRYGLTENWDVGLTLPIVDTFLRVRNENKPIVDVDSSRASFFFTRNAQGQISRGLGFVDVTGKPLKLGEIPFVKSQRDPQLLARAADSATGVGDITLRTKYHLWHTESGGAAVGLNLQLPSGEVKDFHGTDETHLSPFLYLSQVLWDRVEPHLNVGVDVNADDVDRSSFLYAAGVTVLIGTKLGLVVDFLGRSEFSKLQVQVPEEGVYSGLPLNRAPNSCTKEQPCALDNSRGFIKFPFLPLKIKRNDIADFSFGLRYALGTQGSIFFGGIIPLNDDGFRAGFIPSGGVEYTF